MSSRAVVAFMSLVTIRLAFDGVCASAIIDDQELEVVKVAGRAIQIFGSSRTLHATQNATYEEAAAFEARKVCEIDNTNYVPPSYVGCTLSPPNAANNTQSISVSNPGGGFGSDVVTVCNT